MKPFFRQVILLTLYSWLLLAPGLVKTGKNIVTQTYERAAHHIWLGESPYAPPNGNGDLFKYSPSFAALYGAFAYLPDRIQALAWALLGAFVFWTGVSRWKIFSAKNSWLHWAALALVSMELDISLRYQQVNALIVGLVLLGLADYRDKKFKSSGFWLALGTNFKILPGVFVFALPWCGPFLRSFGLTTLGLFLAPTLFLGPLGALTAHLDWGRALGSDMGSAGLLDLESVLSRLGFPLFGTTLRAGVATLTLLILLKLRKSAADGILTASGFTFVASALLLLSPRTESPTFVLVAPAYLLLVLEWTGDKKKNHYLSTLAICAMLITFCYTDFWPKQAWDPRAGNYFTKVFGCFGLWILSATRLRLR